MIRGSMGNVVLISEILHGRTYEKIRTSSTLRRQHRYLKIKQDMKDKGYADMLYLALHRTQKLETASNQVP